MLDAQTHIQLIKTAELQFRLAAAVRLACHNRVQPLDVPDVWVHGSHEVSRDDIALTLDQADYAGAALKHSATYILALQIVEAFKQLVPDARSHVRQDIRAAYEISRLVRNAFAHNPFSPRWMIDDHCRDRRFEVPNVISVETGPLFGKALERRDYGGPLALLALSEFVRTEVLGEEPTTA